LATLELDQVRNFEIALQHWQLSVELGLINIVAQTVRAAYHLLEWLTGE
jgi:hypothetical protein